ncbi:MAG TPA: flagellar protein FlgN [Pusillimonas sp.]|uniref:flagella synthesis protein FlgN n=2 Tax=unclassified Pusillimonas TaxID=2640016 RepID=UPI002B4AD7D4|nr:flagellar protein FlgN [Pusillimonas sp.]HLU19159.1 flagellar protein FlgN [Pusillimonas sp.]
MTASLDALQTALDNELAAVRQFIDILHAEAAALEQPDNFDALNATTSQKNTCIEQLVAAGKDRELVLKQMGFTADRAGLEDAVSKHPKLRKTSQELIALGENASALNAANGAAIDTYLKHTQQALQALQPLVGGTSLYDASGRPGAVKGQRKTITAG